MNMVGTGGYLLHTIKVYASLPSYLYEVMLSSYRLDDPSATAVVRHRNKTPKTVKKANSGSDEGVGKVDEII